MGETVRMQCQWGYLKKGAITRGSTTFRGLPLDAFFSSQGLPPKDIPGFQNGATSFHLNKHLGDVSDSNKLTKNIYAVASLG